MCLVRGDKEKFLGIDEVTQDNFTGVSHLTGFFFHCSRNTLVMNNSTLALFSAPGTLKII